MGFSGFRQCSGGTPFACLIAPVPLPYYGAISGNQQSHRKQFSEAVAWQLKKPSKK